MAKSYKGDFKNHDDDPSLYGYDIKGVRRESKKTVRKHSIACSSRTRDVMVDSTTSGTHVVA